MGAPSFDDLPPEVREYLSDDEGASSTGARARAI
jgi:hypothetical protein